MPLWAILIVLGIVCLIAARYWLPADFVRPVYGLGWLLLILGVLFLILGLLGVPVGSPHLAMGDFGAGALVVGMAMPMAPDLTKVLEPKSMAKSRTVIFNALVAAAAVVYEIAQVVMDNQHTGLDPTVVTILGLIVTIGNIYLRRGTVQPIVGTTAAAKQQAALEAVVTTPVMAAPSLTISRPPAT